MTITYGGGLYGAGLYSAQDDEIANRITAWSFVLDGHFFYVLNLGIQGTLICDVANNSYWYEWNYFGSVGFPCREGCEIDDLYVFGSKEDGQLYVFDPTSFMDDDLPIESYTTAIYPVRGNDTKPCYEFALDGVLSGNEIGSALLLTSDDGGATWDIHDTLTASTPSEEFSWYSLGSCGAPGRIFQVYDTGVFSQISTFFVDMGQ